MQERESRVDVAMNSTVSTGKFFFDGQVANVSKSGIKMTDLPKRFEDGGTKCTTVITGQGKRFKLTLQPCWTRDDGIYKEVGFRIVGPTIEWIMFLEELDPAGDDVWGRHF